VQLNMLLAPPAQGRSGYKRRRVSGMKKPAGLQGPGGLGCGQTFRNAICFPSIFLLNLQLFLSAASLARVSPASGRKHTQAMEEAGEADHRQSDSKILEETGGLMGQRLLVTV
jgi:hypothetical protein